MSAQPEKPQSNAPDFNKLELEVLEYWKTNKIFEKSLEQTKDAESFIFYDGPPFATGLPHYGHILASTIKDAIPRYQTMKGKYVRRRWGWDCHGLPIENIVEQNLKISGKKQIEEVGVERFNKVCRDNVLSYTNDWGKMIERMGRWVEFDNAYKTMDTTYMESVWWGLKQIWDKNLIYEDRKVLLYCSRCETPISNFEVAMDNSYKDVTETSVYVKFKLLPRQRFADNLTDENTFALAWTTTPWTLPGNTALNTGPEIPYVLVENNSQRYILAKDRLEVLDGEYEIVSEFSSRSLEGLSYEPLYPGVISDPENRAHKIYAASFVTTEDGTGIVHNAAMYGEDDYKLAKEKELPRQDMLDHQGRFLPHSPEHLRGVFFKDADKVVLDELQAKNLVYKLQSYTHSYPHCYRCATPLFYNALPAWFINVQSVKPKLLELNQNINWYPEHLKNGRFGKSLEAAPDWNISRNRYWATALPFWKCDNESCKDVVCVGSVEELMAKATNFYEVYPNYTPENLDALDLHRPYIDAIKLSCEKCQATMTRVPEVVDCWVESASMPFAELHYPFENKDLFTNRFPADFVAEYIAQTRAWFYVMHVVSGTIFDREPFRHVVTTGNILAEDGSKMSKSKKNYPDPWVLIEKYGIDVVRFYLLSCPVMNGDDINFSEKQVMELSRKVSGLLWNMLSLYKLYAKNPISEVKPESGHVLDRWIMLELQRVTSGVTFQLDNYNTVKAAKLLVDFINDLSTWYVRRSRSRIKAGGQEANEALETFGYVLAESAKLFAPFMPFLAERVYRDVTAKESVHLVLWPKVSENVEVDPLLAEMDIVREIVNIGHNVRKELALPVRQPLRAISVMLKDNKHELADDLLAIALEELNVKVVDSSLSDKAGLRPETIKTFSGSQNIAKFYLDLEITPELALEGLARELERQVQDLRKKSGLQIGELVDLYYNTSDSQLEVVTTTLLDRKKTFVNQVSKSLEVEVDFEIQAEVGGQPIWLGLVKV